MRVLIVDDSRTDAALATRELGKRLPDFSYSAVESCREALEKISNDGHFDAALIDIKLPDGDGISILNEIRRRNLPISVVLVTAFGDEEVAVRALKAGADDYVVKSGKHYKNLPSIIENSLQHRMKTPGTESNVFRVLLATDDGGEERHLTEDLAKSASHIGFSVVRSAQDLVSALTERKIDADLLLIDQDLAGLNVLDFIRELKAGVRADIPVVVIAGPGNQEAAARAMKLGASDYVVKSDSYRIRLPWLLENALQRAKLERERAALRNSEERYRTISNLVSDYVYEFRLSGDGSLRNEWLSESFERRTGHSPAEVEKLGGWRNLIHDDDREVVREHFRKAMAGGFDVAEFRLRMSSGEWRWLRDSVMPIRDEISNSVVKLYGAAQDITGQKKINEEIRRSEIRFKELADFLPQPVFEIDESRRISFANRACLEVFGVSPEDYLAGISPLDFISPDERAQAADEIENVFRGLAGDPVRHTAVRKSGDTFPALVSTSPISRDSKVVGLRGILVDLTELTAAGEALAESENRYRFIFESSADEFYMMDVSGKLLQVNEAGCEKLGYRREELVGENVLRIVAPEEAAKAPNRMGNVLTKGEATFESVHLRKDGTRLPVEVRSRAVVYEGRQILLSTARDLTERKKAEDAIERRNRQLSILTAASVKINAVLDVGEILRTLVASGIDLVGAAAGTVGLVENGQVIFREYNSNGIFRPIDVRFAPGQGTPGFVVVSKRPRISNDTMGDPLVLKDLHETFGIHNAVDVPIVNRLGEVLGVFAIHNKKDGEAFSGNDVEVLEGLAASAAVALENANLLSGMTEAEAAIRESEEKFRSLVESSLVGVYIIQDGRFVYVNPAMVRMFGYSETEFLELPSAFEITVQADHAMVAENIRKRLNGEVESLKYSFGALKKNGETVQVEVFGSRTTYQGWPAIIGTAEDITERKLSEERLRSSEERYRNLFEESIDAIYVSTPAGKLIDINTAGVKLFGFDSRAEMLALNNVSELYENPKERENSNRLIETEGFMRDVQVILKRKDGTRLIVQDSAKVLRDADGKAIAYRGILRDVTEQVKLEEQLLQSQKLESLGQLTSGIAHDFNNVLGGIVGFTELALAKIDSAHPVNGYLMRIKGLTDRAAKITKQLLAFARRQILMPKKVNLNELIGEILELLRRLLGEQIQMRFVPGRELHTVLADPSQVEQVIMNLAVNAGDAMQNGGTLTIETNNVYLDEFYCRTHANVKPGDYVQVAVSDTGKGIGPEVIDKIFEPFFTTKEVGKGTGLGLSVVHGIVRQHGGTINVYSEPGKGTTFRMYLPAVQLPAEKQSPQSPVRRELAGGTETVLVVEDNNELRDFMNMLLSESGYDVLTASDGEEGLGVFKNRSKDISLVISDIVMPKMGGKDLKEKIERETSGARFLFISGYTDGTVHRDFILDNRMDFLQKPFSAFDFSEKVRNILDRKNF